MPAERIVLAMGCDRDYQLPAAVTLQSLLSHLENSEDLVLYLIHRNLCPDFVARIREQIEVVEIDLPWASDEMTNSRYPRVATLPIYLDQLLPEKRVLFLDTDLLVLDDIKALWQEDLEGECLGAVEDAALVSNRPCGGYFNAGVLLLDLEACRRNGILERARGSLKMKATRFLHQDILNHLARGTWKALPRRWNLLAGLCGRSFSHPLKAEIEAAVMSPGIVHFAGRFKPWLFKVGGTFGPSYRKQVRLKPFGQTPRAPNLGELSLSFYDRFLRGGLYPLERWAWNKSLL